MPSPTKFSVCLIRPEGYLHSLGLLEVCETLAATLRDLDHACTITTNRIRPDHVNIVVGWHLLHEWPSGAPMQSIIVYQLEQLSGREGWWSRDRELLLRSVPVVWDYSLDNILFLERRGLRAQHVPLGGNPSMDRIAHLPEDERDVDVLFYGSLNERRAWAIKAIRDRGVGLRTMFGVYGTDRDGWISRSKIVLNVHYYDTQIPEQVRLSYLLNNGCFVISEGPSAYPGGIVTGDLDQLPELCERFLANPAARREIAYQGRQKLPSMVDSLLPALAQLEAPCPA